MGTRYVRILLLGAGAALLPFAVVVFFTWLRDGRAAGLVTLLGRGELLPGSALLAAQALTINLGAPVPLRGPRWLYEVALCWFLLTIASGSYAVPYSGAAGFEWRMATVSLAVFGISVLCRCLAARREPREGDP